MRVRVRPTTVMNDEREELVPVDTVPPVPPSPPVPPIPPLAELAVVVDELETLAAPPVPPDAPLRPVERLSPVFAEKLKPFPTFAVLVLVTRIVSLPPT